MPSALCLYLGHQKFSFLKSRAFNTTNGENIGSNTVTYFNGDFLITTENGEYLQERGVA
jgi:hypothetical protein